MLEIVNLRQGAVLNHNHGKETAKGLKIAVEGISDSGTPVKVNGIPAAMDGRRFSTGIELAKKVNRITASTMTSYGEFSQSIDVVWDKKSFMRYNYYIDDHIFLFTDLAKQRPKRAFDHFYLAALKNIHKKTGFKVTLNCFYRNDHHAFLLKDMPDIYRSEFVANSDWLKLSFHSYSEFPDRPYIESSAEEFGRDYTLVKKEIVRFAGEKTFIPPVVIHWANVHPTVAQEYIRRGSKCFPGAFRPRVMGGPSLAERQKGGNRKDIEKRSATKAESNDGLALHYGVAEDMAYTAIHRVLYDPLLGIFYFRGHCGCNLMPIPEIIKATRLAVGNAAKVGAEVFCLGSHEQYSFPYYPNYIPDHLKRLEIAAQGMADAGCKPVFFNDGLLGNMAREK